MSLFDIIGKREGTGNKIRKEPQATIDAATAYGRFLKRIAGLIQKLSGRLSRNGQLLVLLLFCMGGGSLSFYLVASSIKGGDSSLNLVQIARPPLVGRPGDEDTGPGLAAAEIEYKKIKRFRAYMDTPSRSPEGKKVFDSILNFRPGLMDSVLFLENMYQSQLK